MHYYQFNIGEYASHTRHLSPIEDIAYRRLLDLAYTSELPLTKDIHQLTRLINLREYQQETSDILKEFFFETDDGWLNNRVIKEIIKTGEKSQKAKDSIAIRWNNERNKKKQENDTNVSKNNTNVNEIDTTNNQLPNTNNPRPNTQDQKP
ncbi:YdaU family protein, partial [Mycoplasmopsis arginini]|uniref:YdaU family protein n=1 Tax=Mycoplasmopsis arginini TaxID=2094 RepID=UPI00249EF301